MEAVRIISIRARGLYLRRSETYQVEGQEIWSMDGATRTTGLADLRGLNWDDIDGKRLLTFVGLN